MPGTVIGALCALTHLIFIKPYRDFPDGPVVKSLHFHCRECGFGPWLAGPALLPHRWLPACLSHSPPLHTCRHVCLRPGTPWGVETAGSGQHGARGNRQHSSAQASAPSRLALPAGEALKVQQDSTQRTSQQNTDPPAETAGVSA